MGWSFVYYNKTAFLNEYLTTNKCRKVIWLSLHQTYETYSDTSSFFAAFEKQLQENTSACDYDVKNDLQNKCKIP